MIGQLALVASRYRFLHLDKTRSGFNIEVIIATEGGPEGGGIVGFIECNIESRRGDSGVVLFVQS